MGRSISPSDVGIGIPNKHGVVRIIPLIEVIKSNREYESAAQCPRQIQYRGHNFRTAERDINQQQDYATRKATK